MSVDFIRRLDSVLKAYGAQSDGHNETRPKDLEIAEDDGKIILTFNKRSVAEYATVKNVMSMSGFHTFADAHASPQTMTIAIDQNEASLQQLEKDVAAIYNTPRKSSLTDFIGIGQINYTTRELK